MGFYVLSLVKSEGINLFAGKKLADLAFMISSLTNACPAQYSLAIKRPINLAKVSPKVKLCVGQVYGVLVKQ